MVPAPVGLHCPACVRTAAGRTRQFVGLGKPYVTWGLIGINVAVAIACLLASDGWAQDRTGTIAIRGGLIGGGYELVRGRPQFIGVDAGEWYRIFTSAFIHGGPMHLVFNMLVLWQIGTLLEPTLGRVRFSVVFAIAILGGAFGALVANPGGLTVGASGGVYGLMGAYFVAERKGLAHGLGSRVGGLIVINLVLSVVVPGISIGGHVGGLVAGTLAGWAMFEFDSRRLPPTVPLALAPVFAACLFLGSLWAATTWNASLF